MKAGRPQEFRYSTRNLDTQKLLLKALRAYEFEDNTPLTAHIIAKEIASLEILISNRKKYMAANILDRFEIEIPENWLS